MDKDQLKCSALGCLNCDFAAHMFKCKVCLGTFCEGHRLKLTHNCESIGERKFSSSTGRSAEEIRDMFASVDHRFDKDKDELVVAPKSHFRAVVTPHASKQQEKATEDAVFSEKLERIKAAAQSSTSSEKNKRISAKTVETLLKMRAKGSATIPPEQRLYFTAHFEATKLSVPMFFPKDAKVSEVLVGIAKNFVYEVFGTPVATEGVSLCMTTFDYPNWKDKVWDRRSAIRELIPDYADVMILLVSTNDIVEWQSQIEDSTRSMCCSEVIPVAPDVIPKEVVYSKGESVLYTKSPSDAPLVASVVGVHLDDFPNVYYTIKIERDGSEKQTVGSRLHPRPKIAEAFPSASSTSISSLASSAPLQNQGMWRACVSHNGKIYNIEFDPESAVQDIKIVLESLTGVPADRQRLACRGAMLNGTQKIRNTKLADGCKVQLIGSSGK